MIAGIDYGSKLAGTTVICYNQDDKLHILQSKKKADADAMIVDWANKHEPKFIMLDAPLSLPSVYKTNTGTDYHYRACDKELKAMSPMFLGGLTARAMKLRSQLSNFNILETYPKQVYMSRYANISGYKESLESFTKILSDRLPLPIALPIENWHQVDAILAWLAGWHYSLDKSIIIGNTDEGLIYL